MRKHVVTSGIGILLSLAGCSSAMDPPFEGDDYEFSFRRECFCLREAVQPVRITVREGEIREVRSIETGERVTVEGVDWYTIEDLLERVEEARDSGVERVVVELDPELGYPRRIEIGTLANDAGTNYYVWDLRLSDG